MNVILGVDPGLSGGLAFIDADGNLETIDMPVHRLKRNGKGKDGSRARASELMPRHAGQWVRVKDDGRAEAALIALHGMRELGRTEGTAK